MMESGILVLILKATFRYHRGFGQGWTGLGRQRDSLHFGLQCLLIALRIVRLEMAVCLLFSEFLCRPRLGSIGTYS